MHTYKHKHENKFIHSDMRIQMYMDPGVMVTIPTKVGSLPLVATRRGVWR